MSSVKKLVPLHRDAADQAAPEPLGAEVVAALDDGTFEVRTPRGVERASRAPSCLLLPAGGDAVWLVPSPRGLVIAAVLSRADSPSCTIRPAVLDLPAGSEIRSAGELRIKARRALELSSPESVRIRGARLEVATLRTRIASEAVELLATRLEAGVESARVAAKKIDTTVDAIVSRVKQSFRWVEDVEQVRAAQLDYRAEGNARLHGDCTFVSADRVVQVRGDEIHLS